MLVSNYEQKYNYSFWHTISITNLLNLYKITFVQTSVCVCLFPASRLLITTHMKLNRNKWLKNYTTFWFLYGEPAIDTTDGYGHCKGVHLELLSKKTELRLSLLFTN